VTEPEIFFDVALLGRREIIDWVSKISTTKLKQFRTSDYVGRLINWHYYCNDFMFGLQHVRHMHSAASCS